MDGLELEETPASTAGVSEQQLDNYTINPYWITEFTACNGVVLTKKYTIFDGSLTTASSANLYEGKYQTRSFETAKELNEYLTHLTSSQAVGIGIPANGSYSGDIVTKRAKNNTLEAISRSKNEFTFSSNLLFDIDHSSLNIDQVIPTLTQIDPNLANASILVRASSSYGISMEGDEPDLTNCSYHVWVGGIKEQSDIARYGEDFAKYCWLNGYGEIKLSGTGAMLTRQLIDTAVFSPERLIFEADAILGDGVVQIERPFDIQEGRHHV